jgi:class III poly(R)-hydroxyalkanoic acid synthase PhaE subunit
MTEDWLQLQRKYWEQWTDVSRKAMGMGNGGTDAWESAMDHWWQAMAPAAPDPSRDFMEKMLEQGKMFFRMADNFTRSLYSSQKGSGGWPAINSVLQDMQKAFTGDYEQGDEAVHKMLAFWELPYDNWQRMMSSLSPIPGDLLRNMPHDQVKDSLHRFLSAPGLGYAREEQSQYQDLIRRTLDYQRALQEYFAFFSHIGVKSIDRMRQNLMDLDKKETTVDSARTLYDNWVSCCEAVYGEEVNTAEYARIHGQLINAQMALKQRMSIIVDEALGALNMPTRSELRTLQDRLQETRRESKTLRRELEALKKQVTAAGERHAHGAIAAQAGSDSPGPVAKAAAANPTANKAPVRKKATVRKKAAARATSTDK